MSISRKYQTARGKTSPSTRKGKHRPTGTQTQNKCCHNAYPGLNEDLAPVVWIKKIADESKVSLIRCLTQPIMPLRNSKFSMPSWRQNLSIVPQISAGGAFRSPAVACEGREARQIGFLDNVRQNGVTFPRESFE